MSKKYVSLDKLLYFLNKLNSRFSSIVHKHNISDIQDYVVEENLSSTSNNPVSNKAIKEKFDEISSIINEQRKDIDKLSDTANAKHLDSTVYSEDGAHGLRFNEYDFELFFDGEWRKLPTPEPMTLAIDLTNSNPNTCCIYEDKAKTMIAGSEDWDKYFGYYPVLMKNGQEIVRLDPNDYSKDIDGNSVDITSGNAGDVMIAFPRRGLRISTADNIVRVSFTDNSNNSDFKYYAHQYNGRELNKFYIGAYEGFIDDNGALRSLSAKNPTVSVSLEEVRDAARLNGDNYEQIAFYQLLYLQCVYLIKYKSLDSQTALGRGRVHYDADYESEIDKVPAVTGTMNAVGLSYGTQTGYEGVKLAGIEHAWGSCYKWLDGCRTDENRNYQFTRDTFGSSTANYITVETTFTSNTSGYLRTPIGNSEGGFLSNGSGGSATTYFSDMQFCNASRIANFGGNWDVNDMGGAFLISFYDQADEQKEHVCGRLMKL